VGRIRGRRARFVVIDAGADLISGVAGRFTPEGCQGRPKAAREEALTSRSVLRNRMGQEAGEPGLLLEVFAVLGFRMGH
jgi:hypothetical protein